jgi:hypothetical protein
MAISYDSGGGRAAGTAPAAGAGLGTCFHALPFQRMISDV